MGDAKRDSHPTHLDDGWPVASPESRGMDGTLLNGLGQQFEAWPDANLHAVLIVRHGALVYERYFTGEDRAWATPLGRVSSVSYTHLTLPTTPYV